LDWTDFDDDDHTTLVASPRTRHGRSTPLVWMTVHESTLKGMRNDVEDLVLQRLREVIASDVKVTILADRGFADQDCMRYWSNWASSMWCAFVRQSRSPAPRGNAGRRPSGCRSAEVPKGCTTNLRSSIEGVM
jgi:hypothetical protein